MMLYIKATGIRRTPVQPAQYSQRNTINHSIASALNETKLNNSNKKDPHNLDITQLIIELRSLSPL
jgi:hypothetical protein